MNIKLLFKLCVASLCALIACWLPQSLSKPHEAGVAVSHFKPVSALPLPKVVLVSYLSPVAVPAPAVAPPAPAAAPVSSASVNCGTDPLMAYIYKVESGCKTGAVNQIGCRGLGQACPGGKLPCGNDWACQDLWFRSYAVATYGSIYNAYLFRTAHNWW